MELLEVLPEKGEQGLVLAYLFCFENGVGNKKKVWM